MDDAKMIQEAYQRLIDTYLASPHRKKVDAIEKAFKFACQAHAGVRRLSGEPYIMHPLSVAQIVCGEIGLGSTSICSALLHDVVEDTDYTVEDIQNIFGPKIAKIVDGVTKISGGIFGNQASAQAETFKKLLLTMSDDIRVILIKISDRLHNMRTLDSQLPAKQYKITGDEYDGMPALWDWRRLPGLTAVYDDAPLRAKADINASPVVGGVSDSINSGVMLNMFQKEKLEFYKSAATFEDAVVFTLSDIKNQTACPVNTTIDSKY